jgi:glycosyltransferase involved in cell wall biosynthesis
MKEVSLTVWMNQPSHYQTAFFDELGAREGVSLTVVYARGQTADRRALGWGEYGEKKVSYREIVLPRRFPFARVLSCIWSGRRAIHLINGVWAVRPFMLAAMGLSAVGADFFFHSEAANPDEERGGMARKLKHAFGRWIIGRSRGMFLIGAKACRYYGSLGVAAERMFKFSYFVSGRGRPQRADSRDGVLKVGFLGQFVKRKRVGDLINAVGMLHREGCCVRLRVIGEGPLRQEYSAQAAAGGIGEVTSIEGPIAPDRVAEIMSGLDVLVLPSTFDGWGLTVNEALHAGVPVVVSDGCGVAEILQARPSWGEIVPVGDVAALAAALKRIHSDQSSYRPDPAEVAAWIGGEHMTDYFLRCVKWRLGAEESKPSLPW